MLYTGCFSYTSRLKWCLQELLPKTSAQYAIYRMFLLHIQAEINISHKPMPSTLSAGCFSYTSKLKWCLQEHLPQTSAQHAIYRMFLLHIQAEMVPTGTSPTNQCPVCYIQRCFSYTSRLKRCLWQTSPTKPCPEFYGMFLLHIQTHMVPLENSHKPMPTTISTRCFSYTSRLKWCLQGLLPQTHTQCTHYGIFLLKIQAEMLSTGNSHYKHMPGILPR